MITQIFHLADLHIRRGNQIDSRFIEYRQVFEECVRHIQERYTPDQCVCVICGDVFHHKLQISPPGISLFNQFIRSIASMMHVVIIQGNHDMLQQDNEDSHDLIKALLHQDMFPNVYYFERTGSYIYENIHFGMVSIQNMLDIGSSSGMVNALPEFPKPLPGYVNIALSHCTVKNAYLHNYTKTLEGIPVSWFKGYDIAMLGDIHLQSVKYNKHLNLYYGYPGSLVQQDFGESIFNHGYLEWNLNEPNNISVDKHHIFNAYAKVNVKVVNEAIVVNAKNYVSLTDFLTMNDLPKSIHVRLYAKLNNVQLRNDIVETFRNHDISAHVDIIGANQVHDSNQFDVSQINLQSLNSNETLIEFVESVYPSLTQEHPNWKHHLTHMRNQYDIPIDETYPKVIQDKISMKNNIIYKCIEESSTSDKSNFVVNILKIKEITFDWILAFGKSNAFHFANNRVVLINAPNGYGKSAFFECIVLGLFGEPIPSRYNKSTALSILNKKKPFHTDTSNISIEFFINTDFYKINRKFYEGASQNKDVKRLLSKNVELYKNDELIKTGANVVNEYITTNLCSVKDFLLSTMVTQNSDNDFFKLKVPEQISLLDSVLHIDHVNDLAELMKGVKKEYKDLLNHVDTYLKSKTPDSLPDEKEYEIQKKKHDEICKILQLAEEELSTLQNLPIVDIDTECDYKKPDHSCEYLKDRMKQLSEELLLLRVDKQFETSFEYVDDLTIEQFLTSVPVKPSITEMDLTNNIQNYVVDVRNARESCNLIEEELNLETGCIPHKPEETVEQYKRFLSKNQEFEKDNTVTLEKTPPREPSCPYTMVVSMNDTFKSIHTMELLEYSKTEIELQTERLEKELKTLLDMNLKEPEQSYHVSDSYLNESKGKHVIQFNEDCWACAENSSKMDTKDTIDYHTNVVDKWTQYNTYFSHKQKISKELDELKRVDTIREEYEHICKMFEEHAQWSEYEKNKSFVDARFEYNKEKVKWNLLLPKIKRYNSWKTSVDKLKSELGEAIQRLANSQHVLKETYVYQRSANRARILQMEIQAVEEQIKYYAKRYSVLKHDRDMYIRKERDLFMYIARHHDKQDAYMDFKLTEQKLCEFSNQIETHMCLFDKLTSMFKKYKSWLYNEKVLPVVVDTTNQIVSSIFAERRLELRYKFQDNTLLWSVVDEDNHIHMEKLSGAQSFAISLGFRLALSAIGITKFKCNQLFIDEGFCSFDQKNLLHVPNLIKNLKNMFDEIILVTHLEEIKNSTDLIINISREKGISYLYH